MWDTVERGQRRMTNWLADRLDTPPDMSNDKGLTHRNHYSFVFDE